VHAGSGCHVVESLWKERGQAVGILPRRQNGRLLIIRYLFSYVSKMSAQTAQSYLGSRASQLGARMGDDRQRVVCLLAKAIKSWYIMVSLRMCGASEIMD